MARLPPSCDALHRSIRVPDLRKGDHSPLRSFPPLARLAIYPFLWLPTQRICRCGHNATYRIPSPPCVFVSRALWFSSCHAVPAAGPSVRRSSSRMSDAVGLGSFASFRAGALGVDAQQGTIPCRTCSKKDPRFRQPSFAPAARAPVISGAAIPEFSSRTASIT
jgi:hypothetical protein